MNALPQFKLTGVALPKDALKMLDEVCEHFVEHAEVRRTENAATLTSEIGTADMRLDGGRLLIDLACPSDETLQMSRTVIAEHLFYFAGEDPLELTWSEPATRSRLANLHEVTVVSAEDVTPHMRRVIFACTDVKPFIGEGMHVRLLVPPKGRTPVWPGLRDDGRIAWPEGEDALLVRVYTIRAVNAERGELSVDFLQHPLPGVATPGADFARDAQPGGQARPARPRRRRPSAGRNHLPCRGRKRLARHRPHRRRSARRHEDAGDHRGGGCGGRAAAADHRNARHTLAAPRQLPGGQQEHARADGDRGTCCRG